LGRSDSLTTLLRSLGFKTSDDPRNPMTDPLRAPVYRRVGADPRRVYGKFAFRSEPSVGAIPRPQLFDAVGDWLMLDELVGSEALYVRVGDTGNPWLRMEEGDILTRSFDEIWVTTGAAPDSSIEDLARCVTEATFLHSHGALKKKGDKSYAFRRGFKAYRGTASTTEQSLFKPLADQCPTVNLVFGKRGGTVAIKNVDFSNTLLVRYGAPGSLGNEDYWPMSPGESLAVGVGSRIHSVADSILVATAAGECEYAFLTSAFDIDRADLDQTSLSGI
jgi:hypothetical protein